MVAGPTPYPDVNELLALLLARVEQILANRFVGMYLYGSLASGDFDPGSSDIDFAVITRGLLPAETISALEAMHTDLRTHGPPWAHKLEGSYVPKDLIRRHDPHGPPCPTLNEGKFYLDQRGSDWIIQRHVMRECGVVVKGPHPQTLIDPVYGEEIRAAVLGILHEWWFPMLDDPAWLRENGGHYQAFAVVTMCRVLHALEHGSIVSKPAAAAWAQTRFGDRWNALIEKALAARFAHGRDPLPGLLPPFLEQTLEFIQFTKEYIQHRNL
jgi:hypothetical protein